MFIVNSTECVVKQQTQICIKPIIYILYPYSQLMTIAKVQQQVPLIIYDLHDLYIPNELDVHRNTYINKYVYPTWYTYNCINVSVTDFEQF